MMKVLFISLGCDKNRVDSEYMLSSLVHEDFTVTDEESQADVIVVNTCCFINDAKEESIQTILEMAEYKTSGRLKALIVAGCMAERYREEIHREIPEVDAVIGTNTTGEIARAIRSVLAGQYYESFRSLDDIEAHPEGRSVTTGGYYAYLKISEGCSKHCTYCIIPSLRGPYRSVPMEDLVEEARRLAAGGTKEMILVAQETTVYGTDLYGRKALPELLDRLNAVEGLEWIRIMYCYPEEIDEALLDAMVRNRKVCHYLDMPIQHINSEILRRMGRRTSREDIIEKIHMIREKMPDAALRTTLIAGFPGETEEQHEELMQFVNDAEFDRLGVFAYSREEDTPAADFAQQHTEEQKAEWRDALMELQEEVIFDKNREMIGRTLPVIIEGRIAEADTYIGRSYRDAPDVDGYVFVGCDYELMSGSIVEAVITGAHEYDLIGELKQL